MYLSLGSTGETTDNSQIGGRTISVQCDTHKLSARALFQIRAEANQFFKGKSKLWTWGGTRKPGGKPCCKVLSILGPASYPVSDIREHGGEGLGCAPSRPHTHPCPSISRIITSSSESSSTTSRPCKKSPVMTLERQPHQPAVSRTFSRSTCRPGAMTDPDCLLHWQVNQR
jgi:hypothetical protein